MCACYHPSLFLRPRRGHCCSQVIAAARSLQQPGHCCSQDCWVTGALACPALSPPSSRPWPGCSLCANSPSTPSLPYLFVLGHFMLQPRPHVAGRPVQVGGEAVAHRLPGNMPCVEGARGRPVCGLGYVLHHGRVHKCCIMGVVCTSAVCASAVSWVCPASWPCAQMHSPGVRTFNARVRAMRTTMLACPAPCTRVQEHRTRACCACSSKDVVLQ